MTRERRLRWLMTTWVWYGMDKADIAGHAMGRWPALFGQRDSTGQLVPADWMLSLAAEVGEGCRWTRADVERAEADLPRLLAIFGAADTAGRIERPGTGRGS